MDQPKVVNTYCVCNVHVASGDPEKVEHGGRRFHRKCFERHVDVSIRIDHEQNAFKFRN